jgi:hypothetical protein
MYREIIVIYSDDLIKLINNVQEENDERLLSNLVLSLQSTELYFNVFRTQQTVSMENLYKYDVSAG